MLATVNSIALNGLEGYLVNIQVDVSQGMPCFEIVGLPDTSIKEAKERVRIAIKNSNVEFLSRKIIVNLAPANTRKGGSFFDLPIAVGVLIANGIVSGRNDFEKTAIIGELSLDGLVKPVKGILPICIEAIKLGINKIILPIENAREAGIVKGLEIIPVSHLKQTIDYLNNKCNINVFNSPEVNLNPKNSYKIDFADVYGQENVKRALEIAAAGSHNVILIGNPGCGKTLLANCMPSILPDLNFEESLETTKIHSISGLLSRESPLIVSRPFRAPHHTITQTSLVGGGVNPKPR